MHSAHVLTLATYGGQGEVRENFSSWVLLEPAPAATAPAAAADAE